MGDHNGNNWGGLNDVTRNQEYANGLEASDFTFGGILGNTNIDTRPSGLRPGHQAFLLCLKPNLCRTLL